MNNEQLMLTRYKVIADFPNSDMDTGEIYTRLPTGNWKCNRDSRGYGAATVPQFHCFPHLFKRLEWWEDRAPEEMPEYVKAGMQALGNIESDWVGKLTQPIHLSDTIDVVTQKPERLLLITNDETKI